MKRVWTAVVLAWLAPSAVADDRAPPKTRPRKPPPAQVTVDGKKALTPSSLAAGAVAARIEATYLASIRRCYGEHLARDPGAKGTLVLGFQVTPRGETSAVRTSSFDPRVDACVAGQAAGWKFPIPASPEGTPVAARFEISFQLRPDVQAQRMAELEEQAAALADLMTSSDPEVAGEMSSRRRPGADLKSQLDAVKERGGGVAVRGGNGSVAVGGAGRGTRVATRLGPMITGPGTGKVDGGGPAPARA